MQCQGLLVEVKDAGLHAGQGVLTPWNLVKGPEQFARILQSCLAALADFQAPCVLLTAGGRVGVTRTQHNHLQTSHPTPWLASSASPSPPVPVCSWQSFINLKKKKKNPTQTSPVVQLLTLCASTTVGTGSIPGQGSPTCGSLRPKKKSQPIHLRVAVVL